MARSNSSNPSPVFALILTLVLASANGNAMADGLCVMSHLLNTVITGTVIAPSGKSEDKISYVTSILS